MGTMGALAAGPGRLLERFTLNVDQVSMAMALASEGLDPYRLEIRWNFPTHERKGLPTSITPAVLHYHGAIDNKGLITRTGVDAVDRRVEMANAAISEIWHTAFPKATFSDRHPGIKAEGVSGPGSRGKRLLDKRETLRPSSESSSLDPSWRSGAETAR